MNTLSNAKIAKMPLFIISANLCSNGQCGRWYWAWQYMPWDHDGYFWTSRQVLVDILKKSPEYNMPPHQFAFGYPEAAKKCIRNMRKQGIKMYNVKIQTIYI